MVETAQQTVMRYKNMDAVPKKKTTIHMKQLLQTIHSEQWGFSLLLWAGSGFNMTLHHATVISSSPKKIKSFCQIR